MNSNCFDVYFQWHSTDIYLFPFSTFLNLKQNSTKFCFFRNNNIVFIQMFRSLQFTLFFIVSVTNDIIILTVLSKSKLMLLCGSSPLTSRSSPLSLSIKDLSRGCTRQLSRCSEVPY